jgi:hypothetical protein
MNIEKIKEHYEHAKEKHPYFCDGLLPTDIDMGWSKGEVLQKIVLELRLARDRIEVGWKSSRENWNEELNCEVWELTEAIYHKDTTAAIEECYDTIAVILRLVDVLEGRQALGNPARNEEKK